MIRYTFFLFCFLAVAAFGCRTKAKNKNKPQTYIDIAAYLKGQMAYLDTVPFALLRLTQKDSATFDSAFIAKADLQKVVNSFIVPELEKKKFEESFAETSFGDATINTITITYNAIDSINPLQRIDVYVNPENNQIRQVYLVRKYEKADSSFVQQLLWKHNKNCTIITSISLKNQPDKTITEKIIWDETED